MATRLLASGQPPLIGARPGASAERALAAGLEVVSPEALWSRVASIAVALPDRVAAAWPWPSLGPATNLLFVAGWPLVTGTPPPGCDLLLAAPKAIAAKVAAGGFTVAVGVVADRSGQARLRLDSWLADLGAGRSIPASPRQEMVADLFSEQALLCGWAPEAALRAYQALVDKGLPPELAWEECVAEMAHVFATLARLGPAGFATCISEAALVGGAAAARRFPAAEWERLAEDIFTAIDDGSFVASMAADQGLAERLEAARRHWAGRGRPPPPA
ncbi:hypothetical protein IIA16_02670 [bacterium]|nr:hypothetical protein [bacterium]